MSKQDIQTVSEDATSSQGESVRQRELIQSCRQLGSMLNAGTEILRALLIVEDQVTLPSLRSALAQARSDMSMGWALAQSFGRHPHLFSPFFVDMVRQGESEGTLGQVFQDLAEYLEKEALTALTVGSMGTSSSSGTSNRPTQMMYSRLAVYLGVGLAMAAICGEYAMFRGSPSLGLAAAAAILGLAIALWGSLELRRAYRTPVSEPALLPTATQHVAHASQSLHRIDGAEQGKELH